MRFYSSLTITIALFFFSTCVRPSDSNAPTFELPTDTGIDFINQVKDAKNFNVLTYRNFYNGAGVGIGDVNNDGLADVFFTSNQGQNKLYINTGDFKFNDVTDAAGFISKGKWATGVVLADVNSDGYLDIYVCYAGYQAGKDQKNELYINNRNLTFSEKAGTYGLDDNGYTTHASFFDFDLDGDLDCFLVNNSFIPVNTLNYANKRALSAKDWPVADFLKGGGNRLLKNNGGKFEDVTESTGIHSSLISFGLGITVGDINGDNFPDVYVSNDFFERDYLYINQKNGTFKDELETWMEHTSLASMGADMADINNDGYPDIFTTDMLPDSDYRLKTTSTFDNIDVYRYKQKAGFYNQFMQNTLQLNNGNGKFMDIAFYTGVAASDWSWGGLIFDMNNDGLSDIYVCNGINHDVTNQDFIDFFSNDVIQKMALTGKKEEVDEIIKRMPSHPLPNKGFLNMGNLKFSDAGESLGFGKPSFSNGAAYGDLDNDGDLDLVVSNINSKSFVYKNTANEKSKNNYLAVFLNGKGNNTFAVGSTIKVYLKNQTLTREVIPARGFQSSVDYKVIFGLGKNQPDSMKIIWPDRSENTYIRPAVNKLYQLQQTGEPVMMQPNSGSNDNSLIVEAKSNFDRHVENAYNDFYQERNILMMLSTEGPATAVGDVNNDGLDDIYIGAGEGHAAQLYIQTKGGFTKKPQKIFEQYKNTEAVCASFFDCDNDGDLDLYAGAGGNSHQPGSVELQNRLFKNDGYGNFSFNRQDVPAGGLNTSVVLPADFDSDGDTDLFVGSRSVPMRYGETPISHIYLNDSKGRFTEMPPSTMGGISTLGMVTDAAYADVTGDGKNELVIVGEWMAPGVFTFNQTRFTEVPTDMKNMFGMWQSVNVTDADKNGKMDIILGNIGENFYLSPDSAHPAKMWLSDFDNDGTLDKIFTKTVTDKDVPVFMKKDLTDQFVTLRKKNLRYEDYATRSVQELFEPSFFKSLKPELFNYNSSCIAFNNGKGKFGIKRLPDQVQFSSVNAIEFVDVNQDGMDDLVLGGNLYSFLPQFSRLDASFGHVLINKGNQNYEWLRPASSGLQVQGEIKHILKVKTKNEEKILFTINSKQPKLYQVNSSATLSK